MELERSENILIVTHQAVLRCIYAYFMKKDQQSSPWLNVPLHTLIKLTPRAYGTIEESYKAGIEAVSTWRGKGSIAQHEDPAEHTESLGVANADTPVVVVQSPSTIEAPAGGTAIADRSVAPASETTN